MAKLIDAFGRSIDYLRISVTDRCDLRCVYCMPAEGIAHKPQADILSFEAIYRIVRVAASLGIEKARLTGGEPLVRKDIAMLAEKLKGIAGLKEICLTTNGMLLSEHARALKRAGLDKINISLDSLVPEKFFAITRGGRLETVLEGIDKALAAGFPYLKVNVVLLKGFNACEVPDFALLAKARPIHVRFIECMPTGLNYTSYNELFSSAATAKDMCSSLGELIPVDPATPGVAKLFRIDGFCGTVGFIAPMSDPFCSSCNKLRLTADGRMKSCLHSAEGIDLRKAIEEGAADDELAALIREAAVTKPKSHNLSNSPLGHNCGDFSMCQIGG